MISGPGRLKIANFKPYYLQKKMNCKEKMRAERKCSVTENSSEINLAHIMYNRKKALALKLKDRIL